MNRDRSPSPEIIRPSRRRRIHTGGVQEAEASSQVTAPQPEEALPELQDPLSLSSIEIDENINSLLYNAFEQYLKRTIPGESVDQKLEYITENVKTSPALQQPPRFPDKSSLEEVGWGIKLLCMVDRYKRFRFSASKLVKVIQVIYLQDMKLSLKNMKEETPSLWSFDNPGEINLPAYLKPGTGRADRKALLVYTEIVRKMLILLGASEYKAIDTDLIGSLLERMYQTRKSYLDALWLHAGNVNQMDSTS